MTAARKRKPKKTYSAQAKFLCYSCGLMCSASIPDDVQEDPVIFHQMPMCKAFEQVKTVDDGVSFLKRCRQKN